MSRVKKLSFIVMSLLLVSGLSGMSYAASYHYATTDMTWAEFYAGEIGETSADLLSEGLDAISTPTTNGISRFPLLWAESDDSGSKFYGVKAVQVRMSEDVYQVLSGETRYTFTDTEFTEYKPVNSDGTFGAMVTDTTTPSEAVVTMATGSSARWGHYVISVASAEITIGSANRYCDYYLGATFQTSDGKTYGLRHDNNIWSNTDIAFCVSDDYVEPHGRGVERSYQYTSDLEGATITKITYMLKGRPDVVIDGLNLYVKKQTTATVAFSSPDIKSGTNKSVNLVFSNVPSDAGYEIASVVRVQGRTRTPVEGWSYSGGVLTFPAISAGTYTATFSSNEYVDISAALTVTDYYAVTDMTWEEFYAGEISGTDAATLDAISSPTARIANRFTQLVSESNDLGGRDITGVKDVQVRMTGEIYDSLSDKTRYTFSDEAFSEYKIVSADGTFGAMVTETQTVSDAVITLSSGASAVWGNYVLGISSVDVTIGSGDTRYYLGALITTSDGKIYGMRHNNNLWLRASDIALPVQEFVEPHGVSRKYAHTSDMEGKTITRIQYMLKNLPDVIVSCDVYLKKATSASVKPEDTAILPGESISVKMVFSDVPDGASYSAAKSVTYAAPSAHHGWSSLASTDFTYSDGVLTINRTTSSADVYRVIFEDESGQYADIMAVVNVFSEFATTDMTWQEFYAGEISGTKSSDLDAISSPTSRVANRFTQLVSESNDLGGRDITGVKDVQVRITAEVYNSLADKSRFTFSSSAFDEYKEVLGDGLFGAMLTETEEVNDAEITLATGPSATWGNYGLSISSVDVTLGSGDTRYYLGALITTSDGNVYGMRHNNNLWFNAKDMAIPVREFVEVHGVSRKYAHTSDMAGKTITKIQYMLKNLPDVVVNCSVYLKLSSDASVSLAEGTTAKANSPIKFTFTSTDEKYDLVSLYLGSGRNRTTITDYTYDVSAQTLTINQDLTAGNYTAIFRTENYEDISTTFYVEGYHYATTDMTWQEFYSAEIKNTDAETLDAISSPTARVAGRFTQLTSEDNDLGGADITGVKDVQVRMSEEVYNVLSNDERYSFVSSVFAEYKDVSADNTFGKMVTEVEEVYDAAVTVSSGASATWGNYVLNISSVDVTIGSGDTRYYLGALITTSDGCVYGMRHNNNLWFNAKDMAIPVEEFVEVHGVSRSYAHTSDMAGKTITQIQYMLKNLPDVVVYCNAYLKAQTGATVKAVEPEGGWLTPKTNPAISFEFSDVPDDAGYQISTVYTRSGRTRTTVEYTYSGGVLTLSGDAELKTYTAIFSSDKYVDIGASFTFYTTDATSLIVSGDNNKGGLNFLLTPRGAMQSIDNELDAHKFVNASDYTTLSANTTAEYSGGNGNVLGSGFTFDVAVNGVSSDYSAIVGFGKMFTMTSADIGSNYQRVYDAINAIPVGSSGFREIPAMSSLSNTGLRVIQVMPNGTARDISGFTGAGALIDDGKITLFYGVMAADSVNVAEGEYLLSPEGETLINDGARDGHIKITMYIESERKRTSESGGDSGDDEGGSTTPTTPATPSSPDQPAPVPGPQSGDTSAPTPGPNPESGDQPAPTPTPGPSPTPSSGDTPAPTPGGDEPTPTPDPEPTPDPDPTPEPTPSVDPTPATPSTPAVDVQDKATITTIIDTLRSLSEALSTLITTNTEVAELPASASGGERSIDDVSAEELAAIPEGETPAVILPIMRVERPAVYVFGVQLDTLEVGAYIFLHLMAESTTTTSAVFHSSEQESEAYTFLDDDGNETKTVPANKHVNVAAYMEPGYTYAPMVTTSDTGTTPSPTPSPEPSPTPTPTPTPDAQSTNPGSSSGGCNSGFTALLSCLLCLTLIGRSKK